VSVLALEGVHARAREGERERPVLADVTLEIEAGELVGIWGPRRSGRTTLLRIAAGLESPAAGTVRFEGQDLAEQRDSALGAGIGYVSKTLRGNEEQGVLEQVSAALLARGVALDHARARARAALAQAGAQECMAMHIGELSGAEALRVSLARTLALSPALLVIDEPTATVELSERDAILKLLRDIARRGTAVLASSSAPEELAGFGRVLSLSDGRLRGARSAMLAPVVALHARGL